MSEVGKITRVQLDPELATVAIDVSISPTREHEDIPYRTPLAGAWFIPKIGDIVEVTKLSANQYVAHSPMQSPDFSFPEGTQQGDIIIKLNESTQLTFRQSDDGTFDITLKSDGDLNLDAENVYIGEDGNRERVATESHTHPYSWTDGGGSGDTDPPNSDGLTDAEVE